MLEKLRGRLSIRNAFLGDVRETSEVKQLVRGTSCPSCEKATLELETLVHTKDGWDAEISCGNCNFRGVVNVKGFTFQRLNSKGKAKE
jgi:transcription elongation factor Elf1